MCLINLTHIVVSLDGIHVDDTPRYYVIIILRQSDLNYKISRQSAFKCSVVKTDYVLLLLLIQIVNPF